MRIVFGFIVTTFLFLTPARVVEAADVLPAESSGVDKKSEKSAGSTTYFGFTPFPYDFSLEAVAKTREIIVPHSTLFALHYDDGVPWKECLAGAPLPQRIQRNWDNDMKSIPPGHVVYVAITPLDTDRENLAPATGEEEKMAMPKELRGVPLDSELVKKAYLDYARRAVRQFHPRYLNIGIETGQLMVRNFQRWPEFERLYEYVRTELKNEFSDVQIGISFGLGDLRSEKTAAAAKKLIAQSDYLGISFYPYGSPFDEKFGARPYRGEKPWVEPLTWLRTYADKPIAICETGFTTQDIEVSQYDLQMQGSLESQAAYTRELFEFAAQDKYLFVVWFLAIDYDKLYAKMPPGSEVMKLWRNIGFIDGELRPKPAWEIWKKGVAESRSPR